MRLSQRASIRRRFGVTVGAAIGALAFCGWAVNGAFADQLPARKPGMWELTVTNDGQPTHTMKQCIDEKTDAKMQQTGAEMAEKLGGSCKKNTLTKTSSGFSGESECTFGATTMSSKSTFTGDFQSAYSGKVETTYTPAFMGKTGSKAEIAAKWAGPCSDGMVPGDMLLPNGMKMNIDQMTNLAQQGAAAAQKNGAQQQLQNKAELERMKPEAMKELMKQQSEGAQK